MKLKKIIGIILMCLSAGLMVLWETVGRQYILEETVLIAADDIHKGELLSPSCLAAGSFRKEFLPEGTAVPSASELFTGFYAARDIKKNEILTQADVCACEELKTGDQSVFPIPGEWICFCSGALRKNDRVRIVYLPDRSTAGTFQVAFVRDTAGQETGQEESAYTAFEERTTGPKEIGTVEIICTEKEFLKLYEMVENCRAAEQGESPESSESCACLLLVPEDVL